MQRPRSRRIAVAALSARSLTEAAVREGFDVVALDVFGDRDTRRSARRWACIGEAAALRIDEQALLQSLQHIAEHDEACGWIAGSGFDGRPELLREGAARLPLIGNDAATVQRVRDPREFFATLDALGIAHPAVRYDWPRQREGWLLKDARACGGWHIRPATEAIAADLSAGRYLQREHAGRPMSATFVADGRRAWLLGINQQLTQTIGAARWVYAGVIGPLVIGEDATRAVLAALQALVPAFGLRGWCSLDFLLGPQGPEVLELNPRPSASLELYAQAAAAPVHWQIQACTRGELPASHALALPAPASHVPTGTPRGLQILFAPQPLVLDAQMSDELAAQPDVHDVPQPGSRFGAGDPVCSVSASGVNADAVQSALAAHCCSVLQRLHNARAFDGAGSMMKVAHD